MLKTYTNRLLFDTNILIDHLQGIEPAVKVLENATTLNISFITWIEVMVGTTPTTKVETELFLQKFNVISMNPTIAELTVNIRQQKRIKLPDAIIWATAKYAQYQLVTRNHKDFAKNEAGVIIPYTLHPKG